METWRKAPRALTHSSQACSAAQKSGKTHCPMICFHVKRGHVRDNKWSVQINQADPRARRRRQQSRSLETVRWLRFDDPSAHTANVYTEHRRELPSSSCKVDDDVSNVQCNPMWVVTVIYRQEIISFVKINTRAIMTAAGWRFLGKELGDRNCGHEQKFVLFGKFRKRVNNCWGLK